MICMGLMAESRTSRAGWAARRRIITAPHPPALAGAVLGLLAVLEAIARLRMGAVRRVGQSSVSTRQAVVAGAGSHSIAHSIMQTTGAPISVQFVLVLCLLCLSTTLPLAFLSPTAAAVTVSASSVLSLTLFQMLTVAGLGAQLIAGYRLGHSGSKHSDSKHGGPQLLAVLLAVPFLVLALTGSEVSETRVLTVLLASLAPAAALAGIAQRARSEALARGAAQELIAGTLFEHTARGERARIARELHDVVAHHISMVAVQAETARLTTPGMPAAGAQRLSEIGDTARAGLTEMRRLLGVLREDAQAASPGQPSPGQPSPGQPSPGQPSPGQRRAERQPQPGLWQLNELLDAARDASGAGTRLIVSGPMAPLDPGVELAAYRIVQEALTNSRRHAPGAAVDVELRYTDAVLQVRIRDNGPGPPSALPTPPSAGSTVGRAASDWAAGDLAAGHGLLGMHERATAVGGTLQTGPAPGGGFLVEASLPARAEAAG